MNMADHLEARMLAHRRWRSVMVAAMTLRILRAIGVQQRRES